MRDAIRPRARAVRFGTSLGVALSALLAAEALALTWTSDTAITKAGGGYAYPGSLAVSSSTVAHMVYEEQVLGTFSVNYKRTTNSGSTWSAPVILSKPGVGTAGVPVIDAYGSAVDAAWVEGDSIIASSDTALMYRRSTDSGVTWQAPIAISPLLESAGLPRIAHKIATATVGIAWTNQANGKVYVRLSADGGATWKTRINLATTTNKPYTGLFEAFPVIAFGPGVIYVGYYSSTHTLKLRRSTDGGVTWKAAQTIATNAAGWWSGSIASTSSTVLFGYAVETATDNYTVYRRSTNSGSIWGSVTSLSSASLAPSFQPVFVYRSGAFRAVYERCSSNACSTSTVYYKTSTTGTTWTTALAASVRKLSYGVPADVDVATKVLVLYVDTGSSANNVYVRRGS